SFSNSLMELAHGSLRETALTLTTHGAAARLLALNDTAEVGNPTRCESRLIFSTGREAMILRLSQGLSPNGAVTVALSSSCSATADPVKLTVAVAYDFDESFEN